MAVQRRLNVISAQRVDCPDLRSIESASSNDFDQLIQSFVTGTQQGYVVRGFNIIMTNAIGGPANGLLMQVDPGAVLHIAASQSGTVLMVPAGTPNQILNFTTNSTNVVGSFTAGALNYVTIDYTRYLDQTTSAQVYLWNPTSNTETVINAPRAEILTYTINISTATPTPNLLPIAAVLTDSGNNVLSVEDIRWMLCGLGTGGLTPDPTYTYPWTQGRTPGPTTASALGVDPFSGGDKSIGSLKELLNAIMSEIKLMKGTPYWSSYVSGSGSLIHLREDLGNTVITGSGNISHGILPNAIPLLTTTGNTIYANNQLTNVPSVVGLSNGDYIIGFGIAPLSTIASIAGSGPYTITMSENATATATGSTVSFYSPSVVTSPGQINWSEPINLRVIGSSLDYVIAANPTSADVILANDQVAYITLTRDVPVTPNLVFTNASMTVTSVGSVPWTTSLLAGDFIRLASDTDAHYYEIGTINNSYTITLTGNFTEASTGPSGVQAVYAFGNYYAAALPSVDPRVVQVSSRESVPSSGDVFWLFIREDDGLPQAKVYIRVLGSELAYGENVDVGDGISNELLQYIGSPSLSAAYPQYVNALNPGSVSQITQITTGPGSGMTASQYFLIDSSADARTYEIYCVVNGVGVQTTLGNVNEYIAWSVLSTDTAAQTATKLALALETTGNRDFTATAASNITTVTNNSAGATTAQNNSTMSPALTFNITQTGTGLGNFNIQDGDSLTLAIKELDKAIGNINFFVNYNYEEQVTVVSSGATPPTSITGPISPGTDITLPNNTRNGDVAQYYTVNSAKLEVFLNGQLLFINDDYVEVGVAYSTSNQIQTLIPLVVGDVLEFCIGATDASGSPGPVGPPGPAGPAGPPGPGSPVNISTKTANYTVLTTDNALLANCASNPITFTLPPAASAVGYVFYFKKIDSTANAMIIQAFGAELIDGLGSQTRNIQWESITLLTDGTSWYIF